MTIEDLARMVRDVQTKQKTYWKERDNASLVISKESERKLSRAVAEILDPPTLFGREP